MDELRIGGFGSVQANILIPIIIVFLQTVCVDEATLVSMLTEGQVFVLNPGQTLDISCEFQMDNLNMFETPFVWKKHQRQEEMQVNILGNIMPPFLATNRFESTLEGSSPRYCLRLRIKNLTSEDSGNYTCEFRGPKSVIVAQVTHFIFVRASVRLLHLAGDNSSVGGAPSLLDLGLHRRLIFIENQPQPLRCFSTGGYPVPNIRIYLGERDLSGQFTLTSTTSVAGKQGLRLMVTQTQLATDGLSLTADDDNGRIKCIVSVPGLMPNVTEVNVEIHYGPVIICSPAFAHLGQRDVFIGCNVRARPEVTSLFWIIDVNGTTLGKGEVMNEYWSLVMVRSDGTMETQLHMGQAATNSFRSYTVVAENTIAITTQQVQLTALRQPTPLQGITVRPFRPTGSATRAWRRHSSATHLDDDADPRYSLINSHSSAAAAAAPPISRFYHHCLTLAASVTVIYYHQNSYQTLRHRMPVAKMRDI